MNRRKLFVALLTLILAKTSRAEGNDTNATLMCYQELSWNNISAFFAWVRDDQCELTKLWSHALKQCGFFLANVSETTPNLIQSVNNTCPTLPDVNNVPAFQLQWPGMFNETLNNVTRCVIKSAENDNACQIGTNQSFIIMMSGIGAAVACFYICLLIGYYKFRSHHSEEEKKPFARAVNWDAGGLQAAHSALETQRAHDPLAAIGATLQSGGYTAGSVARTTFR